MITLNSVYREPDANEILYALLQERPPEANISHSAMPTFVQHCRFVRDIPYLCWYIIRNNGTAVGSIYLTRAREVGIFIFKAHQRHGYAAAAIAELRRRHPGRILANIAPTNERSLRFFKRLGARLIQETYQLPEEAP